MLIAVLYLEDGPPCFELEVKLFSLGEKDDSPKNNGGGGNSVRAFGAWIACAPIAIATLATAPLFAQTAVQPDAQQSQRYSSVSLAKIHRQINEKAILARTGDQNSIVSLSQVVFERIGIPAEIAFGLKYSQRLAQSEVDYRAGKQPPVHEEDLVKAVNNFVKAIGAPEWAFTNQQEVRKLRMQFMARYPQLLAKQSPPNADGIFEALDKNIGPVEAAFLTTSLLYQKLYEPEYQLTAKEQAAGGVSLISPIEFQNRSQILYSILQGKSDNVDLVDLARAGEGIFSDLGIVSVLRPEFDTLQPVGTAVNGRENR